MPATASPPWMTCRREGAIASRLRAAFDFMVVLRGDRGK
jgi:hypothetical protein